MVWWEDDTLLTKDVIFYRFNKTSEMALKLIQRYPPNKQQRQICNRLHVPHLLWSFFKAEILRHSCVDLVYKLFPLEICIIKIPNTSDFGDMTLNVYEQQFISHHEILEKFRQNCICVSSFPSSLLELCMRIIVKRTNLLGLEEGKWGSLLPETLYRQLLFYKQKMVRRKDYFKIKKRPERKTEIVQYFDIHSIISLFKERNGTFSKDFIDWFQNDFMISFKNFKDSHRLILIKFEGQNLFGYISYSWECLECMRDKLRGRRIINYFARTYEFVDITLFDSMRERRKYWCHGCKQVPLFQILSVQDINEQYGAQTNEIKKELFI